MNKTQRGTIYIRQNGNLTYSLWKDSRVLSILSTAHSGFRNKETDQVKRNFSADGKSVRRSQVVSAPRQAIDYQINMGGVDRADQLRSYFTTARKSQMWWKQVLSFLVDVSRVNAWIVYKGCMAENEDGTASPNHGDFVMDLAESLIAGYSQANRRERQDTRALVNAVQKTAHHHERMGARYPKACVNCLRLGVKSKGGKGKKERRTIFGCKACNKHFCYDCFFIVHPN